MDQFITEAELHAKLLRSPLFSCLQFVKDARWATNFNNNLTTMLGAAVMAFADDPSGLFRKVIINGGGLPIWSLSPNP